MRTILAVLMLMSSAFAEDGIQGPKATKPGRQVILSVSSEKMSSIIWNLHNPPVEDDEEIAPFISSDGLALVFATNIPGVYYFDVSIAAPGEAPDKITHKVYKHVLTVGSPGPKPPVPPTPLPDGIYKLAKYVVDTSRVKALSPQLASKLALVYRSVAGRIQDKSIKTPEDANKVLSTALADASPEESDAAVVDSVILEIAKRMQEFEKDDKLRIKTIEQVGTAFNEIALGFENVR